ncbi:hypothetical protein [Streptomyces sp. NPDC101145]|uniref:hypothetical protein n=1 Tax=Streptomyces sp. NPDC101145 TaxID=3366112 RepID=UPI0037FDA0CA
MVKARHALSDPLEGTVRCAQRYARIARTLHAPLDELAALAAPEAPATEPCRRRRPRAG